jgi:choline dehydrogenase-like flavoprotein
MTEVQVGREHRGDLDLDCDVVVVGSGAGGAVVACELAEAGQRVVVLEEGPHVPLSRYRKMRPSQHMRSVWRDGAMTLAAGVGGSPTVNVTMGRCIGGSSMLTGGVCFRTPDEVLQGWVDDLGLTELSSSRLEPFFDQVEKDVHVEEVPLCMRSRSTDLFAIGSKRRGVELQPLRRNTKGCTGCGRCNFGCPEGAKQSVDISYLPRALRAGAQIWSDCLIKAVCHKHGKATGVVGELLPRKGFMRRRKVRVRAKRVVLACGSYHSPLLLLKSGFKSKQIGKNMTLHPAFRMFARFDEPVRGWQGALQSAYTDAYGDQGITLVSLFVPAGVMVATMQGFGPELLKRAKDVPHMAVFGGMIHDEGGGTLRVGPGREPLVTYRMSKRDKATVPTLITHLAESFFAAGAKEVFPPIVGHAPVGPDAFRKLDVSSIPARRIECSSQHPLGSCRMGAHAKNSVVDPDGESWEMRNLFVADGSVVPTSLGVNPQVSIMTMAMRIAHKIRERA